MTNPRSAPARRYPESQPRLGTRGSFLPRWPARLGTRTFGAGPYMIDPSSTVAGDHYTYVPNPNYYDKGAAHTAHQPRFMHLSSVLSAPSTSRTTAAQGYTIRRAGLCSRGAGPGSRIATNLRKGSPPFR